MLDDVLGRTSFDRALFAVVLAVLMRRRNSTDMKCPSSRPRLLLSSSLVRQIVEETEKGLIDD
jgi:hypothetical protein